MGLLCRWFLLEVVLFYHWLFHWVLFHQVEMISFYRILLHFASVWSGRRRYRVKRLCRFKLVWNFNTFDRFPLVGCGLLLRCKRVVFIRCCCFVLLSGRLISGVTEYLHIERHLAAKFGTFLRVFDVIGRLFTDGLYIEVVFFLVDSL